MAIMVACPSCKQRLTFPDVFVGREVQCPSCMAGVPIPADAPRVPDAPARPAKPSAPAGGSQAPAAAPKPSMPKPASHPGMPPLPGGMPPVPNAMPPVPQAARKPQAPPGAVKKPVPAGDKRPTQTGKTLPPGQEGSGLNKRPSSSSGGKKAFLTILVLLLVGGLGAGGYFLYQSMNKDQPDPRSVAEKKDKEDKKDPDKGITEVSGPKEGTPGLAIKPHAVIGLGNQAKGFVLSPDGKTAYALTSIGSIEVVDLETEKVKDSIKPPEAFESSARISQPALSPDGKTLAFAYTGDKVFLVDLETKKVETVSTPGKGENPEQLEFSRDGKFLLVSIPPESRRILDVGARSFAGELLDGKSLPLGGHAMACSPDGSVLAATSPGNEVVFFAPSFPAPKELARFPIKVDAKGPDYGATAPAVAIAPDGKRLVIACKQEVRAWSLTTLKQRDPIALTETKSHKMIPTPVALALNADGTRVVAGCNNGTVHLHDLLTGQRRAVLDSSGANFVRRVAFTPGDSKVVAACQSQLYVWDMSKVYLDPEDTTLVATADPAGDPFTFPGKEAKKDPGKDPPLVAKAGTEFAPAAKVSFPREVSRFVMDRSGINAYVMLGDSSIHHVNLFDRKAVEIKEPNDRKTLYMGGMALSPDGKTLAHVQSGRALEFLDLESKTSTKFLESDHVGGMTFHPDGKKIFIQIRGAIHCFDIATQKPLYEVRTPDGFKSHLSVMAFHVPPDGNLLLGANGLGTLYLIDAHDGRHIKQIIVPDEEIKLGMTYIPRGTFSFTGDSNKAAICWNRLVHIFHLPSQNQRPKIDIAPGAKFGPLPNHAVLFRDGQRLAVATNESRIYLYDVLTNQRRAVLKVPLNIGFRGIGIGEDEKVLVAAHLNEVYLWNMDEIALDPPDATLAAIPDPTDIAKIDPPMKGPGKDPETPKTMPGKDVVFDRFGNPQGEFGLGRRGEFKGKKILVWVGGSARGAVDETQFMIHPDNPMWVALREMGFEVILKAGPFPQDLLKECDQFWLFSGSVRTPDFNPDAVADFAKAGKGLYLMCDNQPYIMEANQVGSVLFGTTFTGDFLGERIAWVHERKLEDDLIRKFGGQYAISDHPIFTGVNFMFEGSTLSHFRENDKLKAVMLASDKKPLIGLSHIFGTRAVVDCGCTRYFYDPASPNGPLSLINRTAGTVRFGQNVAAYLGGKGLFENFVKAPPPRKDLPGMKPAFVAKGKDPFLPMIPGGPFVPGEKLTVAGKLDALYGGWVEPEAGAALLLHKGGLKVYSYPDFKPKAAWRLPGTAQRAAFDKNKGLMYALVPNFKKDTSGKRGASQIMVFEAREVLEGTIKPTLSKDMLKPARTINLPGFCTQIHLTPDGEWLYLLESKDGKSARALRVHAAKGEVMGEVPLHDASDGLALSGDGKHLVAVSHIGVRGAGKPLPGKLQVIDPDSMNLIHSLDVGIDPYDVDIDNAGLAFLSGYSGPNAELLVVDSGKKDGNVLATWRGFPAASCLRLDETGRRLFLCNARTPKTGAAAFTLPDNLMDSETPRAFWTNWAAPTNRGEFLLTPDLRFLICDSGLVFTMGAGDPFGMPLGGGGLGGFPAP